MDMVELTSLRSVAPAAGITRTLHKFVADGSVPHPRTRLLLALYYLQTIGNAECDTGCRSVTVIATFWHLSRSVTAARQIIGVRSRATQPRICRMPNFKPHHYALLRKILSAGELHLEQIDGRVLRPLRSSGLVRVEGQLVKVTAAGKDALATAAQDSGVHKEVGKLTGPQEDLLRLIVRQGSVVPEEVDLRTVRALRARGLIQESKGALSSTPAGAAYLEAPMGSDGRRRRGRPPQQHGRAEMILKAVEKLEKALPRDAEVLVGTIMCGADDVAAAFRSLARKLKKKPKSPEA